MIDLGNFSEVIHNFMSFVTLSCELHMRINQANFGKKNEQKQFNLLSSTVLRL